MVILPGVSQSERPYRATAILLRAEAELLPYLIGFDEPTARRIINDLASIAARIDGPNALPLFGKASPLGGREDYDRIVSDLLPPSSDKPKNGHVSNVAQQLPHLKGNRARRKKV